MKVVLAEKRPIVRNTAIHSTLLVCEARLSPIRTRFGHFTPGGRQMAKKPSKPRQVQNPLTLRFTSDELDDLAELDRQQEAAGAPNISTFAKQLLKRQLYPDPSSEKAVQEPLRELRDDTAKLQKRIGKLDARTKKMRTGVANGIGHLLQSCAGWSEDEVKEWHEKYMRG
jgi:hypothetical protein